MTAIQKVHQMPDDWKPFNYTDPYETLGVSRSATQDEISKAYRILSKKYHPDRNPGDEEAARRYAAVDASWAILGDPHKRTVYDSTGETDFTRDRGRLARTAEILSDLLMQMCDGLTEKGVDVTKMDFHGKMVQALSEAVKGKEKEIELARKQLKALESLRGRFKKKKKKGKEILNGALAFRINCGKDRLKAFLNDKKDMEEALDHLKTYGYDFETPERVHGKVTWEFLTGHFHEYE